MIADLGLPIGCLPVGEKPRACQPGITLNSGVKALEAQAKEAMFGFRGSGMTPASWGLGEQFSGDLGADHKSDPGGEGHADQ